MAFILFRRSNDSDIFPSALNLGCIKSISKYGNPTNVTNFRPIKILPHLSKLFETLILNLVRSFLNHIVDDERHSFRPERSTITCNLSLHSCILDSFHDKCQFDVIYTDFFLGFPSCRS